MKVKRIRDLTLLRHGLESEPNDLIDAGDYYVVDGFTVEGSPGRYIVHLRQQEKENEFVTVSDSVDGDVFADIELTLTAEGPSIRTIDIIVFDEVSIMRDLEDEIVSESDSLPFGGYTTGVHFFEIDFAINGEGELAGESVVRIDRGAAGWDESFSNSVVVNATICWGYGDDTISRDNWEILVDVDEFRDPKEEEEYYKLEPLSENDIVLGPTDKQVLEADRQLLEDPSLTQYLLNSECCGNCMFFAPNSSHSMYEDASIVWLVEGTNKKDRRSKPVCKSELTEKTPTECRSCICLRYPPQVFVQHVISVEESLERTPKRSLDLLECKQDSRNWAHPTVRVDDYCGEFKKSPKVDVHYRTTSPSISVDHD